MRLLAATLLLTLSPVLAALGGPTEIRPVQRQVSVTVNAPQGGWLKLSFEHSPLLPQSFTLDEARSVLAFYHQALTIPTPQRSMILTSSMMPCASGCTRGSWEKRLREEYLTKYGSPSLRLPEALEDSHQVMALRLSTRFMDTGFREAAHELFNDPLFVSGVILSTAIYIAAWVSPEPFFSKAFASALTLVLMTCFTVAEIRNVAVTVMRLYQEAEQARTLPELEQVAERFGKALGGTGLRLLEMVASYGLGKALPPTPFGGLRGRQWAPAGAAPLDEILLTEATTVQVVADGNVIIAGATLGNTAAAARAESICSDGTKKDGGEWHHLATISNRKSSARGGPWTPRFEDLFAQVGMSLNDSANLVYIKGHEGPHSEQYHEEVYTRLKSVLFGCTSLDECKQALTTELKKIADELCTPGTKLNKMLIKKARP